MNQSLEGTNVVPDVEEGTIVVKVKNTTENELDRIYKALSMLFEQGVFNTRNGQFTLHFDQDGKLRGGDISVAKWRDGKEIITRVAMYESVSVELM